MDRNNGEHAMLGDVTEEEIDAYFVVPDDYSETVAQSLEHMSQFCLDQLIHITNENKVSFHGLRGMLREAISTNDEHMLAVLGGCASDLALRGVELREYRKATQQRMQSHTAGSYHK